MKRKLIVATVAVLVGIVFSFLIVQKVNAQALTNGYFVDVSSKSAELYNSNGKDLHKSESRNSDWYLGQTINLQGTNYYQIASDEYLSSKDSYVYRDRVEVIKVTTDSDVPVYDHNFVESTHVALAPGTSWYSDRVIFASGGMPFVRVATDEYVGMWYVIEQSFTEEY